MIKFTEIENKKYEIFNDDIEIAELELTNPSSISNKFFLITNFVEKMSEELGSEFDDWFTDLFSELYENTCSFCKRTEDSRCIRVTQEYSSDKKKKIDLEFIKGECLIIKINEIRRKQLIMENINKIEYFVDKYIDKLNFDYSIFINENKIKKTSIVFNEKEIEKIIRLSSYLKLYSLISNSDNLKLDIRVHKEIFNKFLLNIDKTIIENIFEIIRTKTFRYKQTDHFMWEYIKMIQCKEIETYIVEIFNFLMNNIMVLCQIDKNPITFFVTVVDTAIIWILRSVYKASIIYSDEITSEEIQNIRVNNLKSYSYNDTLGRIKIAAYEWVYRKFEDLDKENCNQIISDFHNRTKLIKQESPLINFLVYPVLSDLTEIPYNYFRTFNFEQSLVLSSYLKSLLVKVFEKNHKTLFNLLDCYPDPTGHVPISTSYKVERAKEYINLFNSVNDFVSFNSSVAQIDLYSFIIGRTIRTKFRNMFTDEIIPKTNVDNLEKDIILFYTYYFANVYNESYFVQIRNNLSKLF